MQTITAITTLALLAGVQGTTYPIGISNCGVSAWIAGAPTRAVTLNQGVTEMMLALGLVGRMVGTAYLDDEIWPELEADYLKVPVLSATYPDIDTLMATQPDFLYASYSSAFQARTEEGSTRTDYFKYLPQGCNLTVSTSRGNRTYCRAELKEVLGIQTYLQTPYCELSTHRPDELTLNELYEEIWDLALIFDAFPAARQLVDTIEGHFENATKLVQNHATIAERENKRPSSLNVLWLDSWDDNNPFVGACCGSVNTIIEYSGATNIFADLGADERRTWDHVSWDAIAERDPDVMIIVDASWDLAAEKIFNLCSNNQTRALRAVQTRRFITVPFSATTLGVRIGSVSYNLAEAVVALANDEPLSSLDFTEVSIVGDDQTGRQAVGLSGIKAYTKLPMFNGVDLDTFCPGESNVVITDDPPPEFTDLDGTSLAGSSNDDFPVWGAVLIVVLGGAVLAAIIFIVCIVKKEKQGNPMFAPLKEKEEEFKQQSMGATTASVASVKNV